MNKIFNIIKNRKVVSTLIVSFFILFIGLWSVVSGGYDKQNKTILFLKEFIPTDVSRKVRDIIFSCIKNKYREILFITGKGLHSTSDSDAYVSKNLSKLKYSVPEFIKTNYDLNKFVVSISNADKKDGGEGALLVKLKNL